MAQSFSFTTNRILTSVSVYFAGKDANPVTIQICNMVNGYPGTVVYAEKVLQPIEQLVSANGIVETKVTFDNFVYCKADEQYCMVVMTESEVSSLYIASLSEKNLLTGAQVTKLPYATGLMFSSCNAITWTAHQSQDLKFKVYTAKFESDAVMEFQDISLPLVNKIMLTADYTTPTGTGLSWEYRVNDSSQWLPISEFSEVELSHLAGKVSLRAKAIATELVAPALALDTLSVISGTTQLTGTYVSKNVAMPQEFTKVKQVMDIAIPTGTSVLVKFATDINGETWSTTPNISTEPVDRDFSRYTFEYELPEGKTNFRCRLDLSTNDPCVRPRVKNLMNILK